MSRILDYVLEPSVVYTNGSFLVKVKVQDDYKYKKLLVSENMKYTTATGTTYTLTNAVSTNNASILQLEGNTTQNGTPTPTSPVEIKTVSGDNNIVVSNEQHVTGNSYRVDFGDVANPIELCKIGSYVDKLKRAEGKQLFDKDNMNGINGWLNASGTMRIATGQADRMFYITCEPNTTYTVSRKVVTSAFRVATYDSTPFPTMTSTNTDYTVHNAVVNNSGTSLTITTGENAKYLVVHYGHNTNDSNLQQSLDTIMINEGSTALPYEPYGNNWYIEKNIGKLVLNGTRTWTSSSAYTGYVRFNCDALPETVTNNNGLNTHFTQRVSQAHGGYDYLYISPNTKKIYVQIQNTIVSSVSDFTTWLSNNNVTVYYIKPSPEYEVITNENLIQQLNNIQNIELIENLCYVDWVGTEKPTMTLQYPTNETLNAYITTEDNKLIRTDWGV